MKRLIVAFLLVGFALPVLADTVYVTSKGKKYHSRYCRTIKKGASAIPRSDAESSGYTPCKVCRP